MATFFMLNDAQRALEAESRSAIRFGYGDQIWRYAFENVPEYAVAVDEGWLMEILMKKGMVAEQIHYGTWNGRDDGLSFQDIVIMRKKDT
jgi:hypothetical protein